MAAIEEAKRSASLGKYAIGAVVISATGEIIALAHTTTKADHDATAHAEVNAIRTACKKMHDCYLPGCWLYTTLEPCPMCAAATIWARMDGIVFGASKDDAMRFGKKVNDPKFTWRQIDMSSREVIAKGNPRIKLVEKFMQDECATLFDFNKSAI